MPKAKGKRKKKMHQGIQRIVEPDTILRKDYKGELRPVPNPIAGKVRVIATTRAANSKYTPKNQFKKRK